MIRLDAVRLVNWYHFADETLRFAGSCLLLGDNGSGKSTVLDALQWALVADQQQVRFNKAANEHSRRNLHGYVRWKLGSEDDTRPGQVRFGRGGCAAYVLLQFTDERDPAGDFTCGIAMEASEADTGVSRLHVVLPRVRVGDVPAVAPGDLVRPLRDFRSAVREIPQARLFADAGTYRDEVRHRLGALPEAFHRLLVKALDFKPLGQVKDFVFNYLLDARPVDTAALQANLEHYKQLEAQARDAERRLRALDDVCAQGERIAQERRTAESHRHLAMQAEREMCAERARAAATAIAETEARQAERQAELGRAESQLDFLGRERDRLTSALFATPGYQQIQSLESDLERTRREIADAVEAEARARRLLESQTSALGALLSQEARDLRRARPALFAADALIGAAEPPEVVARLRETLAREGSLENRDLATWTRRLAQAEDALRMALLRLRDDLETLKQEGHALEAEQADLERGRQRYPDGAEALLHLLRARLRGAREPRPLAELIEVPSPRWRDAGGGLSQHAPLRRDRGPRGLPARPRPLRAQQAGLPAARPRRGVHRQRGAGRHGPHPVHAPAARAPIAGLAGGERRPAGARLRRFPPGRRDVLRRRARAAGGTAGPSRTRSWSIRTAWPGRRRRRCTAVTTSGRRPAPDAWTRSPGDSPRCPRRSSISRGTSAGWRAPPRRAGRRSPRRASCPVWSTRRGAFPTCAPARPSSSASSTGSTGTKSPPSSGSWTP